MADQIIDSVRWKDMGDGTLAPVYALAATGGGVLATCTVFKNAQTTSSGESVVWTPASGKKWRLMRFKVGVTSDAAAASPALAYTTLTDNGSVDLNLGNYFHLPSTAGTGSAPVLETGWIDLGNGILSSAVNHTLDIYLSNTLTSGCVYIITAGTEE